MILIQKQNYDSVLERFQQGSFTVCVVGLGYVGLPLALLFLRKGISVYGIDTSAVRVQELNSHCIPFRHLDSENNRSLLSSDLLTVSTSYDCIDNADVIVVCVPTPITKHLEPDLSYVLDAFEEISTRLRPYQAVVLESTTYPGTTEEVILPLLSEKGLTVGETVFLGYSPEREDPANSRYSTSNIPKVVSGITEKCLSLTVATYQHIVNEVVAVSSTKVAELTKLVENIHRSVNIGLMNELKPLCIKMGIDIFEVVAAASSKPFGFTPYYPGPGLGGHCIPIDPFYLAWKAREFGIRTRFIELAAEINSDMPDFVISKINEALNQQGKSLNGSNLLFLGVAYKKNVEDTRSSPALKILEKAIGFGATSRYCDPFVNSLCLQTSITLTHSPLDIEALESCDICVLLTDHDCFDYDLIYNHANCIVDTRGRYAVDGKVVRG
jgi:UDP-N-acetyl-D-glucosamine dehydrogenase